MNWQPMVCCKAEPKISHLLLSSAKWNEGEKIYCDPEICCSHGSFLQSLMDCTSKEMPNLVLTHLLEWRGHCPHVRTQAVLRQPTPLCLLTRGGMSGFPLNSLFAELWGSPHKVEERRKKMEGWMWVSKLMFQVWDQAQRVKIAGINICNWGAYFTH